MCWQAAEVSFYPCWQLKALFSCPICQSLSYTSYSPGDAQRRRRATEARGVCQQTRACEPCQGETLPAAEGPWLGHCLRHGWFGQIHPGCWGRQTPRTHRRWLISDRLTLLAWVILKNHWKICCNPGLSAASHLLRLWPPVSICRVLPRRDPLAVHRPAGQTRPAG